ncbi:hypothetical protein RB597_001977 [Gaeumannomyces tritici]
MKYETFAAFLISVALPTLAYPAGSSIAGLDAGAAIEQRGEGATIEQREPKQPAHPYPHILRPGFRGPWPVGMPNIRPFPKVAGRSDGDAAIEQRNPRKNNGGNRPPGGPGRLDKLTTVLDTTLPWAQLVNQQQQPPPAKRSVNAEVERREPNRGRPGKPNNNQTARRARQDRQDHQRVQHGLPVG